MSDIVVTVPRWFWPEWIAEGDAAGDPETGTEWGFYLGGTRPGVAPGERLYIVAHNRLRGYAPVVRVAQERHRWVICRRGGAVAVTIPGNISGFRGWRARWWEPAIEVPFPDWKTADVGPLGSRPAWARQGATT